MSVRKHVTLNLLQGYLERNLRAVRRVKLARRARSQEPETRKRARDTPSKSTRVRGSFRTWRKVVGTYSSIARENKSRTCVRWLSRYLWMW